jgi:chromosome partitioning protein
MFTIAVINQKGGAGKTTIACNLASAHALDGKRTLVVDCDVQGTAFDWFTARGEPMNNLAVVKADKPLTRPALQAIARGHDVVILDAPPRLGEITFAAACNADLALIPVQPSPADVWACDDTLERLNQADAFRAQLGIAPVRRMFVINRAIAGTVLARQLPKELADVAEVANVIIHNRVIHAECFAAGESVLTMQPTGRAAEEIRTLYAIAA